MDDGKKQKILRHVAPVAERKRSSFTETAKALGVAMEGLVKQFLKSLLNQSKLPARFFCSEGNMIDQIYSYREMCNIENVQTLQRGMNFHMNPRYSVILMSRRSNAPYTDKILEDGITIEYEGHDEPKISYQMNPKTLDQPTKTRNGTLTQNGRFIEAIEKLRKESSNIELVKVYEKILPGVWSLKGIFDLIDYKIRHDGKRNVYVFLLRLSYKQDIETSNHIDLGHTRLVSSEIKKEVWKRDNGSCVICGSAKNLHFDHDLPFSKGGTSLTTKNIRLLCATCNLKKSDKIE